MSNKFYQDANGGIHPSISDMPFIILKTSANKIRTLRQAAQNNQCSFVDFPSTMTIGTYAEQHEATRKTKEESCLLWNSSLWTI